MARQKHKSVARNAGSFRNYAPSPPPVSRRRLRISVRESSSAKLRKNVGEDARTDERLVARAKRERGPHARGIFTAAAAAAVAFTMAYGFYEPRLVQHRPVHRKQSAYLLHGSLILVRVKYKHGHRASTTCVASLRFSPLPSAAIGLHLPIGSPWSHWNYDVYARTDNFMPALRRISFRRFPILGPRENGGTTIASARNGE